MVPYLQFWASGAAHFRPDAVAGGGRRCICAAHELSAARRCRGCAYDCRRSNPGAACSAPSSGMNWSIPCSCSLRCTRSGVSCAPSSAPGFFLISSTGPSPASPGSEECWRASRCVAVAGTRSKIKPLTMLDLAAPSAPSATELAASAAISPATATTASPPTCPGA
jgi:hypothetical protein